MPAKPSLTITKHGSKNEYFMEESDESEVDEESSLGLAIQMLMYKIFGSIPGPIIFGLQLILKILAYIEIVTLIRCFYWSLFLGYVVDQACLLEGSESCLMYRNASFAVYTTCFLIACKILGLALAMAAFLTSKQLKPDANVAA